MIWTKNLDHSLYPHSPIPTITAQPTQQPNQAKPTTNPLALTNMHTTTTLLSLLSSALLLPASVTAVSCTGYQTTPSNIAACADQLTARGNEICKVTSGFTTTFCEIGDAMIVGVGVETPSNIETSSPW